MLQVSLVRLEVFETPSAGRRPFPRARLWSHSGHPERGEERASAFSRGH